MCKGRPNLRATVQLLLPCAELKARGASTTCWGLENKHDIVCLPPCGGCKREAQEGYRKQPASCYKAIVSPSAVKWQRAHLRSPLQWGLQWFLPLAKPFTPDKRCFLLLCFIQELQSVVSLLLLFFACRASQLLALWHKDYMTQGSQAEAGKKYSPSDPGQDSTD